MFLNWIPMSAPMFALSECSNKLSTSDSKHPLVQFGDCCFSDPVLCAQLWTLYERFPRILALHILAWFFADDTLLIIHYWFAWCVSRWSSWTFFCCFRGRCIFLSDRVNGIGDDTALVEFLPHTSLWLSPKFWDVVWFLLPSAKFSMSPGFGVTPGSSRNPHQSSGWYIPVSWIHYYAMKWVSEIDKWIFCFYM